MSDNSAHAYHKIKANGLLSQARLMVYEVLYLSGPMTAGELASFLPNSHGGRGIAGNVHARLKELEEHGVAEVVRTRKCRVTGQRVYEWRALDALPQPRPQKSKSKLEIAKEEILELQKIILQLEWRGKYVRLTRLTPALDACPWCGHLKENNVHSPTCAIALVKAQTHV